MLVIIEGSDLSGKSTIAKQLSDLFGWKRLWWPVKNISNENKIKRKHNAASGETWLRALEFFDTDIILDRGFISNLVYDDIIKRKKWNNSFCFEVVERLKPIFIYLQPTDEVLENRYNAKGDDFLKSKKEMFKIANAYKTKTRELKYAHNWNIKTIPVTKETNENDVLNAVIKQLCPNLERRDIPMVVQMESNVILKGSDVKVWSNYHGKFKSSKEIWGNINKINIENLKTYYDDDYSHLLEELNILSIQLKKEPTRRDIVLLNTMKNNCIVMWHFMVRDEKIKTIVYLRSSDIKRKFELDMRLTKNFINFLSDSLPFFPDYNILVIQGSAHIYI